MSEQGVTSAIEVRVEKMTQLFDTLDPYPFRERDLDQQCSNCFDDESPTGNHLGRSSEFCGCSILAIPSYVDHDGWIDHVVNRHRGHMTYTGKGACNVGNPTTLICVAGVRADERPFQHCASISLILMLPQVRIASCW